MRTKALMKLFALFLVIWVAVAWYWYTCGIKGFCGEVDMIQDEQEKTGEVVPVNKRSDSGVYTPHNQR